MKRVLNVIGWVGTALVVAAVALRILRPEWAQYATYLAWAGLVWRKTVQAMRRGFLRWRKRDSDFPFWKRKILLSPRTKSLPCSGKDG